MNTAEVVERIKKKLDAHVGVGIAALEPQYESEWKAIFDEADRAGIVLTPIQLENELKRRWSEAMEQPNYAQICDRLKQLWQQWNMTG